ncbi:MAG TPA: sugar phosphate isomerase/epimerase [Firmicutes bacterium]|nr:sugar phosphate isomerase/epimerase [Bacillota bacterium]
MEIGISTASYFPRLLTEDAMDEVARAGAKVGEVFFATHSEYTRDFAAVVKERADRGGVRINSVHALTNQFEPELFGKGLRAHADAITTFTRVCEAGETLGAKYYVFHGATRLKPAVKYVFDYGFLAERVNGLCDIAGSHGITLTYENVHWAYFSVPEYFEKLSPLCPRLGATLDIKQAMQSRLDYADFMKVMGGRLKTVHLCNYTESGRLVMPHSKEGVFDFRLLFKRLKDAGFDGACLIEVYSSCYSGFGEIKESLDYLNDIKESL